MKCKGNKILGYNKLLVFLGVGYIVHALCIKCANNFHGSKFHELRGKKVWSIFLLAKQRFTWAVEDVLCKSVFWNFDVEFLIYSGPFERCEVRFVEVNKTGE